MERIGEYPGNSDCQTYQIFVCPKDCFNQHVGSVIALGKVFRSIGIKGHVTGDVVE